VLDASGKLPEGIFNGNFVPTLLTNP